MIRLPIKYNPSIKVGKSFTQKNEFKKDSKTTYQYTITLEVIKKGSYKEKPFTGYQVIDINILNHAGKGKEYIGQQVFLRDNTTIVVTKQGKANRKETAFFKALYINESVRSANLVLKIFDKLDQFFNWFGDSVIPKKQIKESEATIEDFETLTPTLSNELQTEINNQANDFADNYDYGTGGERGGFKLFGTI